MNWNDISQCFDRVGARMERLKLGISSCLLGEPVRYDGGHRLDRFLRDTLGRYVEFVPVCPEVECGFGVPRESMHLEGDPSAPALITSRTKRDLTDRMLSWAHKRVAELEQLNLCGFIFKSNSPSSGMERVKVIGKNGMPRKIGTGLFAGVFMKHLPVIPVEDDGRLNDPMLRESFIERIFVMKRWRETVEDSGNVGSLVAFHSCHKLLIMAHSAPHTAALGRLVAGAAAIQGDELFRQYRTLLMEALKLRSTVKKNTNVLQHLMGYFKKQLSPDEKQELLEVIEHYHQEHFPLIVPITLIKHYVRKYEQPYLQDQYYLNPHPVELRLRNHA